MVGLNLATTVFAEILSTNCVYSFTFCFLLNGATKAARIRISESTSKMYTYACSSLLLSVRRPSLSIRFTHLLSIHDAFREHPCLGRSPGVSGLDSEI